MYLSKYVSVCGACSRRRASQAIKSGQVLVNGKAVTQPYYEVQPKDIVVFEGKTLISQEKIYVLLNKPKGYLTTLRDEKGRKDVLDLVKIDSDQRIYPVGRLDKMTTGLLLLTNDGDLAYKLTHPKFNIAKKYLVILDKKLAQKDFDSLLKGVYLSDGFIKADDLYFLQRRLKNEVVIQLHSGKNRIVRRMFQFLGYKIEDLDRIYYAGLTKKRLKVGQWRFLKKSEIKLLCS